MNQILKYGDLVFLNIFDMQKKQPTLDVNTLTNGLLGCNGFMENNLWVKFFQSEKKDEKLDNIIKMLNQNKSFDYKTCLFKVLPGLSFIFYKEKLKTEEHIHSLKQSIDRIESEDYSQIHDNKLTIQLENKNTFNNNDKIITKQEKLNHLKEILRNEKERLIKIKQNYELELKDNELKKKEFCGKFVSYEDQIILQHYVSEYFMSVSNQNNKQNSLNKKAILQPYLSKQVMLSFKPRFKYRTQDSYVHYNDDIILTTLKKEFCLKYQQSKLLTEDNKNFQFLLRKDIRKVYKQQFSYKCYFSNEQPQIWRIVFFSPDNIDKDIIQGGDFIRMLHLNNEEYISVDLSYKSFKKRKEELFVPKKIHDSQKSACSIWELNHTSQQQLSQNFVCQNPNIKKLKSNSNITLKNFLLQRLVIINQKTSVLNCNFNYYQEGEQNKDESQESLRSDLQQNSKNSVTSNDESFDEKKYSENQFYSIVELNSFELDSVNFQFLSILQNIDTLINQNAYYISSKFGYLAIDNVVLEAFWSQQKTKQFQDGFTEDDFWSKYKKYVEKNQQGNEHIEKKKQFYPSLNSKEQKKYELSYKENVSADNTYLIEKLSKKEIKDIYFLRSFLFYLMKIRDKIYEEQTLKKINCSKFQQVIQSYIMFLHNQNDQQKFDIQINNNSQQINKKRQSMAREFQIIDLFTDILYLCQLENYFSKNRKSKIQIILLEQIARLTNEALQNTIKKNKQNIQYCSQWFELFVKISIRNSKFNMKLDVEQILIQLVKQNFLLIKNRIAKATIEKFIQLLIRYKNHQHIQILRNIIKCEDNIVYKNQREVTILLLKDQEKKEKFLFKINQDKFDNYLITLPVLGWNQIDLNKMALDQYFEEQNSQYIFFYKAIKLISELASSRNYLCINILRAQIDFQMLIKFIQYLNEQNMQLKIVFIKLLNSIYVDVFENCVQKYQTSLRFICNNNLERCLQNFQSLQKFKNQQQKNGAESYSLSDEDYLSDNSDSQLEFQNSSQYLNIDKEQKKLSKQINSIEINRSNNQNTDVLNKFIKQILEQILQKIKDNQFEFYFIKYIKQNLIFFKVLLKTQIIQNTNEKVFYDLLIKIISELEKRKFSTNDQNFNMYWEQKMEKILIHIKIEFCKIVKVFGLNNFKDQITKAYYYNKSNFKKEIVLEKFFQLEKKDSNRNFIQHNQLQNIFTKFIIKNSNQYHKLTRAALNSMYFFNSKYKYIQNDLNNSVFIKKNNEHIFQYFYQFSEKLRQIAENCQTWLLVDSENQILELKNCLVEFFGIILRSIKEKTTVQQFNPFIEIDSSDLLQLKKFSTSDFILYYINFFFNMQKSQIFLFIQRLSIALPIIRSFFTILSWSFKFRHFGNLKFKKDQRLMYLLIAILCHENELGINFIVKNYEELLINLYERNEDFCIVFFNYCKSEMHFLDKIINKSHSLYNFFYVILKRCAHKNQNDLFKSYNFNILAQILSQQNLQENQRVFNNIQLYIFLNLKKQHNLKLLLRNSVQIEQQSKKQFKKMRLHNHQILVVPPELCLSFSILLLIKKFALGDSKLTKSVCQSFYSISSISKIISSNNINTFFKVEIIDFLNKVYLYKENTNIFNFKEIITHIWIKVIKHLENSLMIESTQSFENKIFKKPQSEEELYFMLTTTFESRQELKNKYKKVLIKSIKLIIKKQISLKLNELDKMSYFSGLIDFITFGLRVNNIEFQNQFYKIIKILKENWSPGLSKKEKVIENLLKDIPYDKYASEQEDNSEEIIPKNLIRQTNDLKNQESFKANRISFLKMKKTSLIKQKQVINPLEILNKKIYQENQQMFLQIIQMSGKDKDANIKNFLKNIIQYLNKEQNPEVKIDNTIVILKIFRSYIENVHPEKISCLDWSENFYDDFTEEIQKKQNDLIDIGIIELVVSNVKYHTQDFELFQETILLAIALLYGGNKIAQKKFYNLFIQNKDNKFLQILKQKFDYFFDYLKKEFEIISIAYIQQYLRNSQKDFLKPLKKKFGLEDWKKRIQATKMIFRFMQLLCEGHNILLQHYLREQFKVYDLRRSQSINFIEVAAQSFGLIVKYLNPEILSIGEQILDFIIESVQGPCVENQKQLFKAKIVDYCNDMFLEFDIPQRMKVQGFYQHENNQKLNSFVVKAVRLLSSLIEASNDENIKKYMADHIHSQYLINHLTKGFLNFTKKIPKFKRTFKIYRKLKKKNLQEYDLNYLPSQNDEIDYNNYSQDFKIEDNQNSQRFDQQKFLKIINFPKFDNEACALFEIFFLLKFLSDYNEKINYKLNQLKENDQLSFQFFDSFTGKVEIIYNNKIKNFLFIIHPCCYYIEKKQLNYLLRGIKRDTPKDKVKDIINFSENIFLVMEHRCKLFYKFKKYGINLEFYNIIDLLITLFGFAINLFMLLFFRKKLQYGVAVEDEVYNEKNIIFMCLGYILFILSLFRLYLWFFIEGSVELKKFLHMTIKRLKRKIKDLKFQDHMNLTIKEINEKQQNIQKINLNQFNSSKNDTIQLYHHFYKLHNRQFVPVNFVFFIKLIRFFFNNRKLQYQITFLIFCIFSLFFNYTFLYSIFLMNIIHHFDILTNLMYALTKNKKQLFITALLAVLVTYFFSVFAFIYLNPDFYMPQKKENICTSIFHCFLNILSLGPRSTGSIGDVILDVSFGDSVHYFIRWVFDFSIWCLINLILLNVIFGVTIDTFAELRDLNKAIDDDLQNKCIICSLERSLLEKYSEGFKYHTKHEHNLDNYLYFIYYLNNKEKTELTGLESYIQENLIKNDVRWIPILKAKSLENKKILRHEDEEEKSVDQLLEEIKQLQEKLPQNLLTSQQSSYEIILNKQLNQIIITYLLLKTSLFSFKLHLLILFHYIYHLLRVFLLDEIKYLLAFIRNSLYLLQANLYLQFFQYKISQ